MIKTCTECKQDFPADVNYFYKSSTGLKAKCKKCYNFKSKPYREKNKEERLERARLWYSNNKERRLEVGQQWRKSNVDKSREIIRTSSRKRRAQINNNGYSKYTEEQVLETYGINCNICNIPVDLKAARQVGMPGWENGLHIDHLVPVSKGGPDTLENVRPTHGLCNITKNNKEKHENQMA